MDATATHTTREDLHKQQIHLYHNALVNVTATVSRESIRYKSNGKIKKTLLLTDLNIGQVHFDHLWIDYKTGLGSIKFMMGKKVTFIGIAKRYTKTNGIDSVGIRCISKFKVKLS
jgi:hypothetical protein